MKKLMLCVAVVAAMFAGTSCSSHSVWTATQLPVKNSAQTASVADLNVGAIATYRYETTALDRRGGVNNCKAAAVQSMLKAHGADIIVAPQYHYTSDKDFIEVTGRPATYKNFRSVPVCE